MCEVDVVYDVIRNDVYMSICVLSRLSSNNRNCMDLLLLLR